MKYRLVEKLTNLYLSLYFPPSLPPFRHKKNCTIILLERLSFYLMKIILFNMCREEMCPNENFTIYWDENFHRDEFSNWRRRWRVKEILENNSSSTLRSVLPFWLCLHLVEVWTRKCLFMLFMCYAPVRFCIMKVQWSFSSWGIVISWRIQGPVWWGLGAEVSTVLQPFVTSLLLRREKYCMVSSQTALSLSQAYVGRRAATGWLKVAT